mmetsp:Transcript_122581/g.354275  ORF Transcript_122581/g.354275 Transcript_122581/m.354275 type:complete len:205 (+) Transcript_122581:625-1239(+)
MLLADNVLSFLGRRVGVLCDQFVAGNKGDVVWQKCFQSEFLRNLLVGLENSLVNIFDGGLQSVDITLFLSDHLFPIPLIDVQGVSVIDIVVTTKSTKVSDNSGTRLDLVIMKGPTLPLGQTKGHFQFHILKVTRGKGGGTFDAIEVVVEPTTLGDKKRTAHALKIDRFLELRLKGIFNVQEGFFFFQKIWNRRLISSIQELLGR